LFRRARTRALEAFVFSGLSQCRVDAFKVFARFFLDDFFSTISHYPWRDFISLSRTLAPETFVFSDLSQCRVDAFKVFAHFVLDDFFRTVSHYPWRDFISLSRTLAPEAFFSVVLVNAGLMLSRFSRVFS